MVACSVLSLDMLGRTKSVPMLLFCKQFIDTHNVPMQLLLVNCSV